MKDGKLKRKTSKHKLPAEEALRVRKLREQLDSEAEEFDFHPLLALRGMPPGAVSLEMLMSLLRSMRQSQNKSLGVMAEETGMDKSRLSKLETGAHPNPTFDTVTRYARALGKGIVVSLVDLPEHERSGN